MRLTPGDLVGNKYRVVRVIGDGGMGVVYEARHERLGVPVALKFLHTELAKRPGLAQRFLQEAHVSASIHSPHVARVTDVDTAADGSPYLVMELLSGESLQMLIDRRGKIPVEQAVDFALQILAGLEAAHTMGVVHRDLKPDNVFVTPSAAGPLLKLIDFGIAKLRASSEFQKGLTSSGAIMGTAEYMAPEQLFAAEHVDHRADLYSLGVILFELLAGQRPADGDDPQAIVARVLAGNVKRLSVLEPALPPELVRAVECALSAEREARFPSAFEMRRALAPFAGSSSYASRLAVTASDADRAGLPVAARTGVSSDPTRRGVSDTLPPAPAFDPPGPRGATQQAPREVLEEVIRASALWHAEPPPQPAPYANVAARPGGFPTRPRRSAWGRIWAVLGSLLGVILVAGAVLAVVFYRQQRADEPEAPPEFDAGAPSATTLSPLVDAGGSNVTGDPAASPTPVSGPGAVRAQPPRKVDAGGVAQPTDAGARDGGRFQFPFPFPSTLPALPRTFPPLPSTFPPLPSTFPALPKGLPTAFPTALPSRFPPFPGFGRAAPVADGGK